MIEKLKRPVKIGGTTFREKINELVDAVNELQKDYDNVCVYVGEQKLKTPAENVQDKFAEQRKWIGKLCRFKDKDYKDDQWDYGLLQAIKNVETAYIWKTGCFKHNLGHWYDYCEPVKPDDSFIYKG